MIRLLRTSARNDGTTDGTWSAGDPFVAPSIEEAYELLDSGRAALPLGEAIPPRPATPGLERAAFGAPETPEHADAAPPLRTRAPARDGGA